MCFKASAEAFKQACNAFSISGRAVSKVFLRGLCLKAALALTGRPPPPRLAHFISGKKNRDRYIYIYICICKGLASLQRFLGIYPVMDFEITSCLSEPAASVGRRTGGACSPRRRAGCGATGAAPSAARGGTGGTAAGVRRISREGRGNKRVNSVCLPYLPYWAMF